MAFRVKSGVLKFVKKPAFVFLSFTISNKYFAVDRKGQCVTEKLSAADNQAN